MPRTEVQPAAAAPASYERFAFTGLEGEVAAAWRPPDLEAAVRRLIDPASARQTLHWGRNYLYAADLETPGGRREVVVKQFRNQGLRARLRRRLAGSKATRSWRAARALAAAGVPTPEPVLLVESVASTGPSYFVTGRLEGVFEARYFFRALNAGRARQEFPQVDPEALLRELGAALARLHRAGIWHRDVSVGNVLLRPAPEPGLREDGPPAVYLVDLNRARTGVRLTLLRRIRDLARLRIFERRHRRLFLDAYWGRETTGLRWLLYLLSHHGFRAKIALRRIVRHPLASLLEAVQPRHAHVHIPPPPAGASRRDLVVWDPLSDQPHQHAGRLERAALRLSHTGDYLFMTGLFLARLPRLRRRYRELRRELYREPRPFGGVGIALRPWPESPDALLALVDGLGVENVLLRLHPWQQDHRAEEELARELHARGLDLTFALPQNRELVRDPARWRAAIEELAGRFLPYGRRFQIGQAINRSKWGLWNHREYVKLATAAGEILRRHGPVELLGPAVIDYEFHVTAALLNLAEWGDFRFDVLSSLLYVDRRGAPEARQYGYDTVDKVLQLKAIADTAPAVGDRCWITEVNWPLWEGPHSPAGRKVAVGEQTQADYLVRYYLLALATGLIERVYWWQLLARGYGLCYDDGAAAPRCRPAFHALRTLATQLTGATVLPPLATTGPARLYRFRTSAGGELVVGWSAGAPVEADLPRPTVELTGRDGEALPPPPGTRVELTPSPHYFRLAEG